MAVKLGSTTPTTYKLGTQQVDRLYQGPERVWPPGGNAMLKFDIGVAHYLRFASSISPYAFAVVEADWSITARWSMPDWTPGPDVNANVGCFGEWNNYGELSWYYRVLNQNSVQWRFSSDGSSANTYPFMFDTTLGPDQWVWTQTRCDGRFSTYQLYYCLTQTETEPTDAEWLFSTSQMTYAQVWGYTPITVIGNAPLLAYGGPDAMINGFGGRFYHLITRSETYASVVEMTIPGSVRRAVDKALADGTPMPVFEPYTLPDDLDIVDPLPAPASRANGPVLLELHEDDADSGDPTGFTTRSGHIVEVVGPTSPIKPRP